MRDFKGMKRQRGRNRSGGDRAVSGKPQQNVNRAFDSNGPDNVKIRGHAQHVFEKYQQLARDSFSSGDRVLAENYLQHADHYFRVLRALQPQRPPSEILGRDVFASGLDIDFEDENEAFEDAVDQAGEPMENGGDLGRTDRFEPRQDTRRDERYDNRRDGSSQNGGQNSGQNRDNSGREGQNRENQNRDYQGRDGQNRDYQGRDGQTREGQSRDYQNRDSQGRDGQNRDGQSRDGQSRDGQSRDSQSRDSQSRDGQAQDGRGRDFSRDQGRDYASREPSNRDQPPRDYPQREGQNQQREGQNRDDRGRRSEARRDDRMRDDRGRDDRPREGARDEGSADNRTDPPAAAEPYAAAQPSPAPELAVATAQPTVHDASPMLRSEDGGVSEAPAFLQAMASAPVGEDDGGQPRRPRVRRRRVRAEGEGEAGDEVVAPEAAKEA